MLEMLKPEESVTHLQNYYFPPYITLAHLFHAEPGWHLSRRKLSQYQLQYVIEGEALYEIEGTEHHTTKGDLVIHFPEQLAIPFERFPVPLTFAFRSFFILETRTIPYETCYRIGIEWAIFRTMKSPG